MRRDQRSRGGTRRFTIVIALVALVAGGTALAGDADTFADARDGSELGRPGNGPRHEFVERLDELMDRIGRAMGGDASRLFGRGVGSCWVACQETPPVVEPPPPPSRPNLDRPVNRSERSDSRRSFLPR